MIRIIGILCGSALAISLLIIVLGIPEILPPQPAAADSEKLALKPPAAETVATTREPEPEPAIAALQTPPSAPAPAPGNVDADVVEASVIEERSVEASVASIDNGAPVAPPTAPVTRAEDNWYAFWSPFRSEIAANGFVSQLQRTTGLDYRVVKIKTGVYEVAFAYADDADIETKLAAISTATGLDLPGG